MQPTTQKNRFSQFRIWIVKKWQTDTPVASIFRDMTILATGSGAAKAIGLFSAPIITRIYTPEHMGVLAVFTAFTFMLVPFGTLRYNMAIPLPQHDGLATNLVVLCGIFLSFSFLFAFVVLWLTAPSLFSFLSMEELLPFWWLLPVAVAGTGLYEMLTNWAVREKEFKPIAKTKVWQKISGATLKILLGLLNVKPLGLLIGFIFTSAGGVGSLLMVFQVKLRSNLKYVTIKRMKFLIMRYGDFPKYRLPSRFLLSFSTKLPIFFFASQFDPGTTGQLGLSFTMLAFPMALFGSTTSLAYYGQIAGIGQKNRSEIYKTTKGITKRLFLVSIGPCLILIFFGPWIFQVVFGSLWRDAGHFAGLMSFFMLAEFVTSPITNVLNVINKQDYFLKMNIIRLILSLIVFSTSYLFRFSPSHTLLLYSLSLSAYNCFFYYNIMLLIGKKNLA